MVLFRQVHFLMQKIYEFTVKGEIPFVQPVHICFAKTTYIYGTGRLSGPIWSNPANKLPFQFD